MNLRISTIAKKACLFSPIRIAIILLLSIYLIACTKTIEEGGYKYLDIGITKDVALMKLISNGVASVAPFAGEIHVIKSDNLNEFDLISQSKALALNDHKGYFVKIAFDGDEIGDIYSSLVAQKATPNIFVKGQTRENTISTIKSLIAKNKKLTIYNVEFDPRWVDLTKMTEEDKSYLLDFNFWEYPGTEDNSYYNLYFDSGKLKKIKYSWSFIELP